jgi:ABC-2 type transport system ATP-binding protein
MKRFLSGGPLVAESSSELVVETSQLTKISNNRQIQLNDVSLRIEPGCVLGLLGSNGAGKTTLLRLAIGLHRPTAGWVKVFGRPMTPNAADLRRRIGYTSDESPVSHRPHRSPILTIWPVCLVLPKKYANWFGLSDRAVDLLPHSGSPIDGFSMA